MDIALNEPEREIANDDTAEGLRCNTFFEPSEEEIARRAYDLYLARGQVAGHEMDDWIEAKHQLFQESKCLNHLVSLRRATTANHALLLSERRAVVSSRGAIVRLWGRVDTPEAR